MRPKGDNFPFVVSTGVRPALRVSVRIRWGLFPDEASNKQCREIAASIRWLQANTPGSHTGPGSTVFDSPHQLAGEFYNFGSQYGAEFT